MEERCFLWNATAKTCMRFEEKLLPSQSKQKAETAYIDRATVAKISSMIARRPDGFYTCTDCEYTTKSKGHMQEHVEKHIKGLEYACNSCPKILRVSLSFKNHKRSCHIWKHSTLTLSLSFPHLAQLSVCIEDVVNTIDSDQYTEAILFFFIFFIHYSDTWADIETRIVKNRTYNCHALVFFF